MKPSEKQIDRVDQFFKNKLGDHSIVPAENAWAKVEAGLSKKNNVMVWRLAAAVLLMGALVTFIYWSQSSSENDQPALAQKKIEKAEPNKALDEHSKAPEQKVEPLSISRNNITATKKSSVKSGDQSSRVTPEEIHLNETVAIVSPIKKMDQNTSNEITNEEKTKLEATSKTTVASSQQKPIKLEFTLEDLTSVETVATTNEVKNTGLKKVLELAREMKEGEGPLSNLKEKKNELFARNFITGKEKTQ